MTKQEENTERRHIYETRLGIFGLGPNDYPTADQHNLAVDESDQHMSDLRLQESKDAISPLLALRESL
jgi:hypothetical protein